MSQPYVGEIDIFAFQFAPSGWMQCNGQLLPISSYQALFALLGTTFGGDGIRTFGLPSLQGRVPVGQGNGAGLSSWVVGQSQGEVSHTLQYTETPQHTHGLMANNSPTANSNVSEPSVAVVLAQTAAVPHGGDPDLPVNLYVADPTPNQALASTAISTVGGTSHGNMMPYLTLNFCIAIVGIFPSRS
jgi:microcystin-dependent protein